MKIETKDWILASLSGAALVWSIVSYFLNRRSSKSAASLAARANTIAEQTGRRVSTETELSVLRLINESRMRANELCVKIADLEAGRKEKEISADEKRHLGNLFLRYEEAVEVLLNSYELACGLFIDGGKLDDDRFYRQYHDEIKKLYELPDPYHKRLHPLNSPYIEIRKVYQKWRHDLQK